LLCQFDDTMECTYDYDYTASIDWGDGEPDGEGTITRIDLPDWNTYFTVTGSHEYKNAGTYEAEVTLVYHEGEEDPITEVIPCFITIDEAPLKGSPERFVAVTGQHSEGVLATFEDENANSVVGDFSAEIQWGDGYTSVGTVEGCGEGGYGPYTVSYNGTDHAYDAAGDYAAVVTITHAGSDALEINVPVTASPPTCMRTRPRAAAGSSRSSTSPT